MEVQIARGGPYVHVMDFEWDHPLESWNDPRLVRMARGPSRHVVRFVELEGRVLAIKEIGDRLAKREYTVLREMLDADIPAVEPICTVTERRDPRGEALPGAVVTRYLDFALPYTYLLARENGVEHQRRLTDAAAVLLVHLHLEGFWWGDCSLANILFRRDAGGLAAYLVDSETAEHHARLSDRQRETDLDIAVDNIAGGVADLLAAGRLEAHTDPLDFAQRLETRYRALWGELTVEEEFGADQLWRLDERIARLNRLGFDATELSVRAGEDRIRIRPSIVEEGHHSRRLRRLTGIEVQENQARRLLNDLGSHRAAFERREGRPLSEAIAAHRWLTESFEPFVSAIPGPLAARLEPAEAYHQYLEHRWFLSEAAGRDVPDDVARRSFFDKVLSQRPEERVVLPDPTGELDLLALEEAEDPGDPVP
ncbi:DUF4032 domain-containing protein [Acidimicrobiaceae bacterium USS-CC1]|uniref:DUF4032 domain-containing protein n=1 Tax=Acidiferrimicrobium australe TaxID=2664430 RepID=A0ABW9QQF0_9ACTN|nr:DUF4032 domain-containing protein [Acidiferrimicrobium australe]